jgi:hypothetical protein
MVVDKIDIKLAPDLARLPNALENVISRDCRMKPFFHAKPRSPQRKISPLRLCVFA